MSEPIQLAPGERIVAVVPERYTGPGWSNRVAFIYITDGLDIREECIQSEEFPHELWTLFSAGEVMCRELRRAMLPG